MVFKAGSLLCVQGSLLMVLGDHMWCSDGTRVSHMPGLHSTDYIISLDPETIIFTNK